MPDIMHSRCKLAYVAYKVVDEMMFHHIEHLPGGTVFWRLLPKRGPHSRRSARRALATFLVKSFFPSTLLLALLKASVDPIGQIDKRGAPLHRWLVRYVYCGDETLLYREWMSKIGPRAYEEKPLRIKVPRTYEPVTYPPQQGYRGKVWPI